jgi:N-acetylneuraminic acid mutarotase
MTQGKITSTRSIFTVATLTIVLVVAALPLAAQTSTTSDDPSTPAVVHNTWTTGTPMPSPITWATAAVLKNQIYLVAGINSANETTADVEIYNPIADTWSTGVPLPEATYAASSAVVNGVLYVFGGYGCGGTCGTVWAFTPKTNSWTAKAHMLVAQGSAGAVVYKNIIYVIGGNTNGAQRITTVESYNPATNTWKKEHGLRIGKSETSAGVIGDTIVAADGYTKSGDTGDNEAYDIATNTWTHLASDPTPRNGACTGAVGAELYLSDGDNDSNNAISVNESFNPKTDKWKTLATMPETVTDMGSAVYNGKLYCIGGGSSAVPFQGSVFDYVQIYQP